MASPEPKRGTRNDSSNLIYTLQKIADVKQMSMEEVAKITYENTKNILKYVKENFDENTYISIMAQYFPTYKAKEDKLINRKLTKKEYKEIENYLYLLNLKNGYIQELGEHEEEYVPNFDLSE